MNYNSARGIGRAGSRPGLPRNADIAALFPGDSDSSDEGDQAIITNATRLPITSPPRRPTAVQTVTTATDIAALFPVDRGDEADTADGGRASILSSKRQGRNSVGPAVRISNSPTRSEGRDVTAPDQQPQNVRGISGNFAPEASGLGKGEKGQITVISPRPATTTSSQVHPGNDTMGLFFSGEERSDRDGDIEAVMPPKLVSRASSLSASEALMKFEVRLLC